ncbi:glutamate dehydrogenase [Nocardioides luteus]|uniref:NAD-glutamate dehydrogenase n=1 Tax=Nocardioides luteus TaxID=1844 RepID=A0ABQ5T3H3_9ACTN|nr:NAD-glutamate dehydrogenase [Nocardioides luteus]MDR7309546.1 glutamate dehydrogenase [Nocardioides luteus]GGR51983.1 NAD-glutamate dehydrogenase [Nocardioides luteus]GLJ70671.1 NAD-glutamate dehydrogenase [Nocardioides luteus]
MSTETHVNPVQAPQKGLQNRLPSTTYFRHVAPEELTGRSEADLAGAVGSHLALAANRPQGTAAVRILTPTTAADGWSAGGRSVVEIVVDDMPYLVDSVKTELYRRGLDVHLVVHPVIDVARDVTGALEGVNEGDLRESWMHIEIDRLAPDAAKEIVSGLEGVLEDVREVVEDEPRLHRRLAEIAAGLRYTPPNSVPREEAAEAAELLAWLAEDHFLLTGYREYRLDGEYLRGLSGTGLGILRADPPQAPDHGKMPPKVAAHARDKVMLVLAKANSRSTVGEPAYLDHVGIKIFNAAGEVIGEHRFLGLFTTKAARESVTRIPVVRGKVAAVLDHTGYDTRSHTGKAMLDAMESYPREELFHASADELISLAEAALGAIERRILRVAVRPDTYGRYVSVLVSLPRDRYNTAVRERFSKVLLEALGGDDLEFTVRISESTTARVHFVVHGTTESLGKALETPGLVDSLESQLRKAARSWRDDLVSAVIAHAGEEGAARLSHVLDAFPEAYKEDFDADTGAADLTRLELLSHQGEAVDFSFYKDPENPGGFRIKIYRTGGPLSLSAMLPILSSFGFEVTDERPYDLEGVGTSGSEEWFIYDFGLTCSGTPVGTPKQLVAALHQAWSGRSEVDGLNALVLAGLDHSQITVLRAYGRYLRQAGTPSSFNSIAGALCANPGIARQIVELFETRFDPSLATRDETKRAEAIIEALDDVVSLDQDRILRSYVTAILATMRTNHYRGRDYVSFKFDPQQLPDLPLPRPAYEIFVYSPQVEGVHLRFDAVARGGLRWSDRRDDFRTEVLGLAKAQQVKNTVIVPGGAKGGFVAKGGVAGSDAYVTFLRGLLDITDNRVDGEIVPPVDVVRHDGDDSYLVVAADKGTATFSDLANSVAAEYDFWLGDAFASGGSAGYDHKAMGITSRGAWVSVQHHFKRLGIDTQTDEFTAVGIGDMSGDVFGNGMLRSDRIRLVAAFDHRHIFIDPTPDATIGFQERKRLFETPRSTWESYDTSLISAGGGVWSRQLKWVPISPEVREALGLAADVKRLTPTELISAILRAPVDLLWNGGIGTYIKASTETDDAAGDHANDGVRVGASELRVRVVGEGGNLGITQAGRVEFARKGGLINTDAIDNSAGVDTSDHEVNLKILLDREVRAGSLTLADRDELLEEMTDEVAALVLADNEAHNETLTRAVASAPQMLEAHERQIAEWVTDGVLDREVEGLPSATEVARRLEAGEGLTAPELAVVLAWTKIERRRELVADGLPDPAADPEKTKRLMAYFPTPIRERFPEAVVDHPLRREIWATSFVNEEVNRAFGSPVQH